MERHYACTYCIVLAFWPARHCPRACTLASSPLSNLCILSLHCPSITRLVRNSKVLQGVGGAHLYGSVWRPLQLQLEVTPPLQPLVYCQEETASSLYRQCHELQTHSYAQPYDTFWCNQVKVPTAARCMADKVTNWTQPHQPRSPLLRPNPRHPHLQANSLQAIPSHSVELQIRCTLSCCSQQCRDKINVSVKKRT